MPALHSGSPSGPARLANVCTFAVPTEPLPLREISATSRPPKGNMLLVEGEPETWLKYSTTSSMRQRIN